MVITMVRPYDMPRHCRAGYVRGEIRGAVAGGGLVLYVCVGRCLLSGVATGIKLKAELRDCGAAGLGM